METFQPSEISEYEDLESKLNKLGLNRQNFRVLTLLPSIYVAWSDQDNQAPKTFLIVLSDGEDNQG